MKGKETIKQIFETFCFICLMAILTIPIVIENNPLIVYIIPVLVLPPIIHLVMAIEYRMVTEYIIHKRKTHE